jgi:hypothetical protein
MGEQDGMAGRISRDRRLWITRRPALARMPHTAQDHIACCLREATMAWIACAVPGGGTVYVDMAHAIRVEPNGNFTKIIFAADGMALVREKGEGMAAEVGRMSSSTC